MVYNLVVDTAYSQYQCECRLSPGAKKYGHRKVAVFFVHPGSKPPSWLAPWNRSPERCFCLPEGQGKNREGGVEEIFVENLPRRFQVPKRKKHPQRQLQRHRRCCGKWLNARRI